MKTVAITSRSLARKLVAAAILIGCSGKDPGTGPTERSTASVIIGFDFAIISVGENAHFNAIARDAQGQQIFGKQVSWSSSDPSKASIDQNGVVTANAKGDVTISAVIESVKASASLQVVNPLQIKSTDASIRRGVDFAITGSGFSDALFFFDAIQLAPRTVTDSTAVFQLPDEFFLPCIAPGRTALVKALRSSGKQASISAAIAEIPLTLTLAAGQDTVLDNSRMNCKVVFNNEGDYLVMPFTRERSPGTGITSADSAAIELSFQGSTQTAATARMELMSSRQRSNVAAWSRVGKELEQAVPRLKAPATPQFQRAQTTSAAGCNPSVGESILIPTSRTTTGQLLGPLGSTSRDEPWLAVAASANAMVLVDSSYVRRMNTEAGFGAGVSKTLEMYENTVLPYFNKFSRGIPDGDNNGRLFILLGNGGNGDRMFPKGPIFSECIGKFGGETIFLGAVNGQPRLKQLYEQIAYFVTLGYSDTGLGGLAFGAPRFYYALAQQGGRESDLFGDWTEYRFLDDYLVLCNLPDHQVLSGPDLEGVRALVVGCFAFSYLMQRAVESGQTLKQALVKWTDPGRSDTTNVSTIERAAAYLGIPNPRSVYSDFLIAWYTDNQPNPLGQLPEISMWNTRSVLNGDFFYTYHLPDATIGSLPATFVAQLGSPDVRYITGRFAAGASTTLRITRIGFPIDRMQLAVVRMR